MDTGNQNKPGILNPSPNEESSAGSWLIALALSVLFLLWGLLIYFAVGDSWPPPWRYGTVPDVPGQSVYAVSQAEERAATAPSDGQGIREQHVMGKSKGIGKFPDKGGL